ncbi:unnamed protein product [Candida verbasci]|uniref:Nonsense-mediated decay protein 4 n=1 Tax=Candida verbasci TaxID=1227364 RepID=A0A9W4X913_9ASCO|nr:unnamed protein product [Candida verbasci]
MSDSFSNDENYDNLTDELTQGLQHNSAYNDLNNKNVRQVRLILDHTAFVRGIGNVKRWFNKEYIKSNVSRDNELINLNIYIPSYTLHEFDFAKKGTSISATNAREAIKFIDTYLENVGNLIDDNKDDELENYVNYNVEIESPNDNIPNWNQCSKFKVHSPRVKEFPNFKTTFDSHLIGQNTQNDSENMNSFIKNFETSVSLNKTESSMHYQNVLANQERYAEMPVRLKYLIKTCIFKRFLEKTIPKIENDAEQWKLVTENSVTKIWAKSFGIDCLNVNEAELLIFQNYDVNSFRNYNPFNIDDEFNPKDNILQNKIDTTLYSYRDGHQEPVTVGDYKKKRRNRRNRIKTSLEDTVEGIVQDDGGQNGLNPIKKEKFNAINYAPRGKGELWRP